MATVKRRGCTHAAFHGTDLAARREVGRAGELLRSPAVTVLAAAVRVADAGDLVLCHGAIGLGRLRQARMDACKWWLTAAVALAEVVLAAAEEAERGVEAAAVGRVLVAEEPLMPCAVPKHPRRRFRVSSRDTDRS